MNFSISNYYVYGLERAVKASGNPMRTKIDTSEATDKDFLRAAKLGSCQGGEGHDNYLKGINVQLDVSAPLYWWKEAQRYHWFEFISSQSTMHCLLKFGDNGDAFVSDYESDLINGKAELYFVFYQFGFQCDNPVPESIWDKCFKPYATYHAGTADEEDFLEDCDIYDQPAKGWFYSRGVLEALKAEGIRYVVK